MEGIKEAYFNIPPVSRYYISLVFLQSFAVTYKLLNPYYLILDFDKVFGSLQVKELLVFFDTCHFTDMETDNQLCLRRFIQHELYFHNDDAFLHFQGMRRILQIEIP
jgi:hypothetical protein